MPNEEDKLTREELAQRITSLEKARLARTQRASVEEILRKQIEDPNTPITHKTELAIVLAGLTKETRSRRHDRAMQRIKRQPFNQSLPASRNSPPLGQVASNLLDQFMKEAKGTKTDSN